MTIRRLRWYVWLLIGVILVPPFALGRRGDGRSHGLGPSRSWLRILEPGAAVASGSKACRSGCWAGFSLTNLEIGSPKGPRRALAQGCRRSPGYRPAPDPPGPDSGRHGSRWRGSSFASCAGGRDRRTGRPDPASPVPGPSRPPGVGSRSIIISPSRFVSANVSVVDMPTQTELQLQDVEGEGYSEGPSGGRRPSPRDPQRRLGSGSPRRSTGPPRASGPSKTQFRADDVKLDERYENPEDTPCLSWPAPSTLKGRLDADIYVQGQEPRGKNSAGRWPVMGVIAPNPIELDGAPLVAELSRFVDCRARGASARSGPIFSSKTGASPPTSSR